MPSPISLELFDFIDDFARAVRAGNPRPSAAVTEGAEIVVFCESFFDQLFANVLKRPIEGFTSSSQKIAARLAEAMHKQEPPPLKELRALIALFEGFCEMHEELILGSYAAGQISYGEFHNKYMCELLALAGDWASAAGKRELAERIETALTVYDEATGAKRW
jgi:hypothetical protein